MLGVSSVSLSWDEEEGLGDFEIIAHVCDQVADDCLDIDVSVRAESPAEVVGKKTFVNRYYAEKRPALIGARLKMVEEEALLHDPNSVPPLLGFLAGVFSENPELKESLKSQLHDTDPIFDQAWNSAVSMSKDPLAAILSQLASTSTNDMLWGAYFATGEARYLEPLVARLSHLDERRDMALFLAAGTAKWSLLSNARQHGRVREQLAKMAADPAHPHHELFDLLVANPDQDIRGWMTKVMSEQREKGIW